MFAFRDLIDWYSGEQQKKLNDRLLIWRIVVFFFCAGALLSLIWIWPNYPKSDEPFEYLYSEEMLPTWSLLASFLLVSFEQYEQLNFQMAFIKKVASGTLVEGKICADNIEALTIELIKHDLLEEIKYPEIKGK